MPALTVHTFRWLCVGAIVLGVVVVALGASTRLRDAGLGCPDWPGCYGHLLVPLTETDIETANRLNPENRFDAEKAWWEVAHRAVAGAFGLVTLLGMWMAFRLSRLRRQFVIMTGLVAAQALFGYWTVSMKLLPEVVTTHLLGGHAIVALWVLALARLIWSRHGSLVRRRSTQVVAAALIFVVAQTILGGWVSSNYAALSCPDFPTCLQGAWLPDGDYVEAMTPTFDTSRSHLGGQLQATERAALHALHRVGALFVVALVLWSCFALWRIRLRRWALFAGGALALQLTFGLTNVLSGLPIGPAVAHNIGALLLSSILLSALVRLRAPISEVISPWPHWRDLWTMTKPNVVAVMLFTALVGALVADPSIGSWTKLLTGLLGIALASGGAAVMNHLLERDIDAKMVRTKNRPAAQGRLHVHDGWMFAIALVAAGLTILLVFNSWLSAFLTAAAFLGYSFVYTAYLKPRTSQNIVIGGLSGALPPLLGWTAVTSSVHSDALLLVLIIFAWTPPHFWALALARREDYFHTGIPMLPVTHGDRYTLLQMTLYAVLTLVISLLPFVTQRFGIVYLMVALGSGLWWLWSVIRVHRTGRDAEAWASFRVSIWYIMIVFAIMPIDLWVQQWLR